MQASSVDMFDTIVKLLKEVKPGLADRNIQMSDSLIEDLGLDSLDMLQLSRKINRATKNKLDLESWSKDASTHRSSIQSVIEHISGAASA
jgi:acyl carrier protein